MIAGEGVHLLLVDELQPVLDRPQEAVRLGEGVGVLRVDVPPVGHLAERVERVRAPQCGVVPAVHELQQLHRELDVADATPTALHLAVVEPAPHHSSSARAFIERIARRVVGGEGPAPQARRGRLIESPPELAVAGDRSGFEQGLELPRLGPPLPVRLVRLEGADQRAVATLGPQVGVDAEAASGDLEHARAR